MKKGIIGGLMGLFALLLFHACAPVRVTPPTPPFTPRETERLISTIREQQRAVQTFYSSGRVTAKRFPGKSESEILIIGKRTPAEFKIELTHSWGQPLFYLLIQGRHIQILDFGKRKLYYGQFGDPGLSDFLPGLMGPDEALSILRGFPALVPHKGAVSQNPNQITLLDEENRAVEVIDFYPESLLPSLISFPLQDVRISFSDYQDVNGLLYARSMEMKDAGTRTTTTLKLNQMVFNRVLPAAIFQLDAPTAFQRVPVEKAAD